MLAIVYYKGIAGISITQGMAREFNNETVTRNLYSFIGSTVKEYLPRRVMMNGFLEKVNS